jgi:acetyl-CoA carboxylase biotin carboxyl carrier protein
LAAAALSLRDSHAEEALRSKHFQPEASDAAFFSGSDYLGRGQPQQRRAALSEEAHSGPRFSGSRRAAVGYGPARMAKDIKAHITGTVWKIEVKVGDQVDEGTTVVILESMKMEMPVESEDEGKVETIHVTEGQAVTEGQVLVTLA